MFISYTDRFEAGEYALCNWTCDDAITRGTTYKVLKRTPKRVTLAAIYPNGLDNPVTIAIEHDGRREVVYDKGRYYGKVIPAKAVN